MTENQSPALRRATAAAIAAWKPLPRYSVSEWAGRFRYLSPESSAEPGLWLNARAPHLVKPMDCLSPDHPAERIVCKFSSQTGKTEILLNAIGFVIDCDPGPILALQPNARPMGVAFSKDRVAPMIRDCETLTAKVSKSRSRVAENTIDHKVFNGGHLTISGANSSASLASRPIRYLLCDEIDRWGTIKDGDPLTLARKRLQTFRVRRSSKELIVSSPTYKDLGISVEYEKCSQQWEWHIPCLHCGHKQRPTFKDFHWTDNDPRTVRYACTECGAEHPLEQADRIKALGEWVCTKDGEPDVIGFWMSQWLSPFARWDDTVAEWLEAGSDPAQKQAVTNTVFAEAWEGEGDLVAAEVLEKRAEEYPAEVPNPVRALTIGVDVQADRLELEVVGWGERETSWSIAYDILPGEPVGDQIWKDLAEYFQRTWEHETGAKLSPVCMCVDAGNWSKHVYDFVKKQKNRRIIPVKGASAFAADEISGTPRDRKRREIKRVHHGRPIELIGVGKIKRIFYQRLALKLSKPGSCHFPPGRGREYYDQLTAERLVAEKKRGRRAQLAWQSVHPHSEALDCRVYAYAGLLLSAPDLSQPIMPPEPEPEESANRGKHKMRRRKNFVNGWR